MHLYMLYIKPDERRKTFGSSKKKTVGLNIVIRGDWL